MKDSDGSIAGCHKTKAMAQAHMAALYANEPDAKGYSMGNQDREIRVLGLDEFEIRHSGRKDEAFTIRGYPAVYGQVSHDLGGFREILAPGAFDEILATNPDVHFTWDHDTRYVVARTKNNTLHLESDSKGLFMDAQVGNYPWAKDLRTALDRQDIDQGSFAFTVAEGGDEFTTTDEYVLRTINNVGGLYDVTVTAQGAYPQTSLAAIRSLAEAKSRLGLPITGEDLEAAHVAGYEQGVSESHGGSVEAIEEFMRWKEARIKKAAAHASTLAKLAERLGKLE